MRLTVERTEAGRRAAGDHGDPGALRGTVTLEVRTVDAAGHRWCAAMSFRAGEDGVVDTSRDPAADGPLDAVDPTVPFGAREFASDGEAPVAFVAPADRSEYRARGALELRQCLAADGPSLDGRRGPARAASRRRILGAAVPAGHERRRARGPPRAGLDGRRGVGARGGAARLARLLRLGCRIHPGGGTSTLASRDPVEGLLAAARALAARGHVGGERTGWIAASVARRGALAALALADAFRVCCAVTISPSSVI
jgi:hypothetical protein